MDMNSSDHRAQCSTTFIGRGSVTLVLSLRLPRDLVRIPADPRECHREHQTRQTCVPPTPLHCNATAWRRQREGAKTNSDCIEDRVAQGGSYANNWCLPRSRRREVIAV